MIKSLGRRAVTVATILAAGGLGATAVGAPARASAFSTAFTCNIGNLGQTAAVLNGWLASPGTTFSGPARFQLHISSLTLQAPMPIDSWSGAAWIDVGGAENTTFQLTGSGGAVPEQGALVGDMAGDWAPIVAGTDLLSIRGIEITATSAAAGNVPVQCVPSGSSAAEVLQVATPYHGPWIRPRVPIFRVGVWYRPGMHLRRPVWHRPGWYHPGFPGHPGGWHHLPGHPGGWYHPGLPGHPGGWYHPGLPGHPGGWYHPGLPGHPGGWNHPGLPGHPGGWNHPGGPPQHGPAGVPGHGPAGVPGHGPVGVPGHGPAGVPGHGPAGVPGHGPAGVPGHGPAGVPGHGPNGVPGHH